MATVGLATRACEALELTATTDASSADLLSALSGELTVRSGDTEVVLTQGGSCVVPAALGAYTVSGEGVLLRSYIPA